MTDMFLWLEFLALMTALFTSAGVASAILVHGTYTLLGIGLIISKSLFLFSIIKIIGVLYLLWMGISVFRASASEKPDFKFEKVRSEPSAANAFILGFLTNLLNPKAVLFFLALFSSLVSAKTLLTYKSIYVATMSVELFIWFALVSVFFTIPSIRGFFYRIGKLFNRVTGATLIMLAIGAEAAKLAGAAGYIAIVNYVGNEEAANKVVSDIEAAGGKAFAVQGDVFKILNFSKSKGVMFGFINNAGVVDKAARLDEMSHERLNRMFAINLTGAFLCAREAVKAMSTRHGGEGGSIINIISAAAKLGAGGQYIDYASAKGAIDIMIVGLAREVAEENVRVNGVRPETIDTDIYASGGQPDRAQELKNIIPMKRPGQAVEVAKAIMWLLSDESSYSTGAIIDVSGGRSVSP